MLPSILSTTIVLFQMMCVVVVFAYLITRTRYFGEVLDGVHTWKNQLFLIVLFGILSIYGSVSGIVVHGAPINIRDLGPIVAGLVGGPLVGLGAGLIGAAYRATMGGFTMLPCCIATVLAGLLAGLVWYLNKKAFPGIIIAVSFTVIIEGMHMGLVLLLASPLSQAVALVSSLALPMIAANAAGVFIFAFIINNLTAEKRTQSERDRFHQELERKNAELQIAREIQASFLPSQIPVFPGYSLAAMSLPAREVGGDFYDVIPSDGGGRIGLMIADVSDKGVPAALFMALSRTVVRANAAWHRVPSEAILDANTMIAADAGSGMFVTLFYGALDPATRTLTYVNAGHNPPLLLREGERVEYLEATGIALGAAEGIPFEQREAVLNEGDVLVLYTDGVTESVNEKDEQLGVSRLVQVIAAHRSESSELIISRIGDMVKAHAGTTPQYDDITLMVLKVAAQ